MANGPRFRRIDQSNIRDHPHLKPDDECFFLVEYTSGKSYAFSATNGLISNLKKKPSKKDRPEYVHKLRAMRDCSRALGAAINADWLRTATLVPVPPSKAKGEPEYDDRMLAICHGIPASFPVDVRELILQHKSIRAAHESSSQRPSVAELREVYSINAAVASPTPTAIGVVDDVLTAGTHFQAICAVLRERFPSVPIVGFFIARRVFPPSLLDKADDAT